MICDQCTNEMKLISTSISKKKYKIKKYECDICGYQKSIYGDGHLDDGVVAEYRNKEAVDRMYKQQEDNDTTNM